MLTIVLFVEKRLSDKRFGSTIRAYIKEVFINMANFRWKCLTVFLILLLLLFTGGCIDMEVDLAINNDGTGKATVTVIASEPYYNEFVDEFVEDVRQINAEAKISESYQGLNKTAQVELSFNDISELATHGLNITYYQDEQINYIQIEEIQGVPVKITLNMPGQILASNGDYSGSKVTWDKGYMDEPYWAESELGGTFVMDPLFLIGAIIFVAAGFGGWYFTKRKKNSYPLSSHNIQASVYCDKCGLNFDLGDRYCANCGFPRIISSTAKKPRKLDYTDNVSKLFSFERAFVIITVIASIIIIAVVINEYYKELTTRSDNVQSASENTFQSEKSFIDYSDGWLMGGANITNSYYYASEKELFPPFRASKVISIPADFMGENITLDENGIYVSGNQSNYNAVYKFDRITGELLWSFKMVDAGESSRCPVAITEQFIICGGQQSNNLYFLDKTTGEVLRSKEIVDGLYENPPKVYDGFVYVYGKTLSSNYCFLAYDIDEDKVVWEVPIDPVQSEIAIFDNYIVGAQRFDWEGGSNTVLYSRESGEYLWGTADLRGNAVTTDGGKVYTLIGDSSYALDRIIAYNINTGISDWERQLSDSANLFSKLALSDQYLVAAVNFNDQGKGASLFILENNTGVLIEELPLTKKINSLVLANEIAFFSTSSEVYYYHLNSGFVGTIDVLNVRDLAISNGELLVLKAQEILIYKSSEDSADGEGVTGMDEAEPVETEEEIEEDLSQEEVSNMIWAGGTYSGSLIDGIPHGYGTWYGPDGKIYYGDFENGKMTGYGRMVFPGGEEYIGDFLDGVGHGQGTMTHPDGRSISGVWENGDYKGN